MAEQRDLPLNELSIPALAYLGDSVLELTVRRELVLRRGLSTAGDLNRASLAYVSAGAQSAAMQLAERVRDALPGVKLMTNHGGGNFKKQFARADKWGASIALVLGESEVANGEVVVKDLRSGEQTTVTQDGVAAHLRTLLG